MFKVLSPSASLLSITLVGQIGSGSDQPQELEIPFQPPQDNAGTFSLLTWRSQISKFVGRDQELEALDA